MPDRGDYAGLRSGRLPAIAIRRSDIKVAEEFTIPFTPDDSGVGQRPDGKRQQLITAYREYLHRIPSWR